MTVKVLVVEDEALIAFGVETELQGTEFEIVAQATTVSEALKLVETPELGIVLLDGNLRGESAAPVAERLAEKGIPFIILTGYSSKQLGDWLADGPRLNKPYAAAELLTLMRQMV